MLRAEVHDVLRELAREFEQRDALLCVVQDLLGLQVEQRHVPHVVQHLIEANMLVGELLTLLATTDSACLDVPDSYRNLLLL